MDPEEDTGSGGRKGYERGRKYGTKIRTKTGKATTTYEAAAKKEAGIVDQVTNIIYL